GHLALDGDVVLVDVRTLKVRIDAFVAEVGGIARYRAPGESVTQAAAAERVAVAELVGGQQIPNTLDGDGRVEEPEPAAQHGLVALVAGPREDNERAEVVHVG